MDESCVGGASRDRSCEGAEGSLGDVATGERKCSGPCGPRLGGIRDSLVRGNCLSEPGWGIDAFWASLASALFGATC